MYLSRSSNTIFWRGSFYSILYSCSLCHILTDHIEMGLFLGSVFCSIGLYVCSYASIRLFWLQWSYNKFHIRYHDPSLFFFVKIIEAIQGHLWFHINFWNICSIFVKYVIDILIGIALSPEVILHGPMSYELKGNLSASPQPPTS